MIMDFIVRFICIEWRYPLLTIIVEYKTNDFSEFRIENELYKSTIELLLFK